MKIFLDTADVAEIREYAASGLVDGVTTNPSLAAKEKRAFRPLVEEICSIVPGDVSLEVVATDFEGMINEARELAQIGTTPQDRVRRRHSPVADHCGQGERVQG